MQNQEIEIQVKIEHKEPLLKFLKKEAQLCGVIRQVDEYFTPKHRDFTSKRPVCEWLRLRNEGNKFLVCYKNWHKDKRGHTNDCDEYETAVENMDSLRKLMVALDMKLIGKVDKLRQIYRYQDYEIAIDKVTNIGDFVEIEYKGNDPVSPEEITDQMIEFLKNMGVGKITRNFVGYAFMAIFPEEKIDTIEL